MKKTQTHPSLTVSSDLEWNTLCSFISLWKKIANGWWSANIKSIVCAALSVLSQFKTICMFDVPFLTAHFYLKEKYCPWPQTVLFYHGKDTELRVLKLGIVKKTGGFTCVTTLLVCCGRLCALMKVINLQSWLQSNSYMLWQKWHHFYLTLCHVLLISDANLCKREKYLYPLPPYNITFQSFMRKKSFSIPLLRRVATECGLTVMVLKANLFSLFL